MDFVGPAITVSGRLIASMAMMRLNQLYLQVGLVNLMLESLHDGIA
jgi:hypothetical protein